MGKPSFIITAVLILGKRGKHDCVCPLRLSYKTVDSYRQITSHFRAIGRDGEWDKRLGLENAAAERALKDCVALVTAEQLQAGVTPKQASPFFVDKLAKLDAHLNKRF